MFFSEKSLSHNEFLKKSGQLPVKMNLMHLLIIEVIKCVRGINLSYLNNMFIALHLIMTFGISPGCYNLNSIHTNLDINL